MTTSRIRVLVAALALAIGGTFAAVGLTASTVATQGTATFTNTVTYDIPTVTETTTSTVTVTTPAPSNYIFNDEFDGTTINTAKWVVENANCFDPNSYSCNKSSNVLLPGDGYLHLRAKRETSNYRPVGTTGGPYSGSWISTFKYDTGWPTSTTSTNLKAQFPVPFRYEYRAKQAPVEGAWASAGWLQNTDKSLSQGIWELDVGEFRSGAPTTVGCYQHKWITGGQDSASLQSSGLTVTDWTANWHVVTIDVTASSVTYKVDGTTCATYSFTYSGNFGLILHNGIGSPSQWGTEYGTWAPDSGDAGPWDLLVDYVRVTPL